MQNTDLMSELEKEGWQFILIPYYEDDDPSNECLWQFKSPRMNEFYFLPAFTGTKEELLALEREYFVSLMEISLDQVYNNYKNKLLDDYRQSFIKGNAPLKKLWMKIDQPVCVESKLQ